MDQNFKLKSSSSGKIMWTSFMGFYAEWWSIFGRPRSRIPSFLSKSWEATLGTTREISSSCLERFRAGINIANKRADKVGAAERSGLPSVGRGPGGIIGLRLFSRDQLLALRWDYE